MPDIGQRHLSGDDKESAAPDRRWNPMVRTMFDQRKAGAKDGNR